MKKNEFDSKLLGGFQDVNNFSGDRKNYFDQNVQTNESNAIEPQERDRNLMENPSSVCFFRAFKSRLTKDFILIEVW